MNLYRLDYSDTGEPVTDFLGPRLFRRYLTAINTGREIAQRDGRALELSRINGGGGMRRSGTITTSGLFERAAR